MGPDQGFVPTNTRSTASSSHRLMKPWRNAVLENALDAVVAIDTDDRVVDWNRQAESVFGWSKQEAIGKNLTDLIIPPGYRDAHRVGMHRYLNDGVGPILNQRIELTALHRNGRVFPIELTVIPVEMADQRLFYSYIRDISEQIQSRMDQRFLADLSLIYANRTDPGEIIAIALEKLAGHLQVQRSWLTEVDFENDKTTVEQDYSPGLPSMKGTYDLSAYGEEALRSWAEGRVTWNDDVTRDPRTSEFTERFIRQEIRAFVSVPLHREGKMIGSLGVGSRLPRAWSSRETELIRSVAETLWSTVENARLFTALHDSNRRLQEAVHARDEFLSIASHELKTPITSLKLQFQTDALLKSRGDPRWCEPARVEKRIVNTNRQLDRMAGLIEEMLDVSRISMGKMQLMLEATDFSQVVQKVVDDFRGDFDAEGIALTYHSPGPVPVRCDRYRMEQVVVNLLTNALKYGNKKPVKVEVTTPDQSVRLTVRDQGIGIEPQNLQRVFERYERAISPTNVSGFGLGLYISREIVTAHEGGKIWAESVPGRGSLFIVELPRASS